MTNVILKCIVKDRQDSHIDASGTIEASFTLMALRPAPVMPLMPGEEGPAPVQPVDPNAILGVPGVPNIVLVLPIRDPALWPSFKMGRIVTVTLDMVDDQPVQN